MKWGGKAKTAAQARTVLAEELDRARERSRLAATKAKPAEQQKSAEYPDSVHVVTSFLSDTQRAKEALDRARKRWLDFVKDSIVPEDLK